MTAQLISSFFIFAVGVGLGVLLQRYVLSRGTQVATLERQVDKLKGDNLHLQDAIQQHFHQTADLTQSLTTNYKALYEHLAQGSNQFAKQPLADLKQVLEGSKEPEKVTVQPEEEQEKQEQPS
jgi:uncharacterized membrane-anchored protein YhcB (DUF1043 family)